MNISAGIRRILGNGHDVEAAISGIRNRYDEDNHEVGANILETANRYRRYQQLALIDPYVSTSLLKLGLTIGRGFETYVEDGGAREAKELVDGWAAEVNLDMAVASIGRLLARDGTVVLYMPRKGDTITALQPLPMQYATLLPRGMKPKQATGQVLKGEVELAVLNESGTPTTFSRDEFALFRLNHEGTLMADILGRQALGIYGVSLLEPIDRTIKHRLDILEGYTRAIRRYGIGRLHIDYKAVESLIEQGRYEEAKGIMDKVKLSMEQLEQNEDIVGAGFEVKPITTGQSIDIVGIKESLERDIAVGLLQDELTTGKASGSTFASSYVAQTDRILVLQSIQRQIRRVLEREVIGRQCELWGLEPSVKLKFDELVKPKRELRDMLKLYLNGVLTESELRESVGLAPRSDAQERQDTVVSAAGR